MHKLKSNYRKLNIDQRLYQCEKPIISLSGGIASGKSTVANLLSSKGLPLIDADKLVKEIYAQDKTKEFIANLDSSFLTKDKINFSKLRECFFSDTSLKDKIEKYIYQKLPQTFHQNYQKLEFSQYDFLIYDIPLLHEKNLTDFFDVNILVYAPRAVQLKRLLARDRCSIEVAQNILNQQLDIDSKRQKSDLILENSSNLNSLEQKVHSTISLLTETY